MFCGINNFRKEDLGPLKSITGVLEEFDIESNIQLITNLHPMCSKIVMITDNTITGQRIQKEIQTYQRKQTFTKVPIELIYDVSTKELKTLLYRLDPNSIVLFTFFFRDNKGEYLEYDKASTLFSRNCNVPVYGVWKFHLESGIIGGYLTAGYLQDSLAAQSALKILKGTPANKIPIIKDLPSQLNFDYNQLERFDIALSDLPENAIILNGPDKYRQLIIKALWIIGVMIINFGSVHQLIPFTNQNAPLVRFTSKRPLIMYRHYTSAI